MIVLVNEIEKENLVILLDYFKLSNEVTILDFVDKNINHLIV